MYPLVPLFQQSKQCRQKQRVSLIKKKKKKKPSSATFLVETDITTLICEADPPGRANLGQSVLAAGQPQLCYLGELPGCGWLLLSDTGCLTAVTLNFHV